MTVEHLRLDEAQKQFVPWKKWGPYLSERQWDTVCEDYNGHGPFGGNRENVLLARTQESNAFSAAITPPTLDAYAAHVMRQREGLGSRKAVLLREYLRGFKDTIDSPSSGRRFLCLAAS